MASPFEDRKKTGSLTASWNGSGTEPANTAVTINMPAKSVVCTQLDGTFTGTITWEASANESTFITVPAINIATGSRATTATAAGLYAISVAGAAVIRARCSAYTSGTILVTMRASQGAMDSAGLGTTGGSMVDTELPAAALIDDTQDTATIQMPQIAALVCGLTQGGTTMSRVKAHTGGSDARGTTINGLVVEPYPLLYSDVTGGAQWDRERNNSLVQVQASTSTAAGTVNTAITNYNGQAIIIFANVSSYGAAGTFLMKLQEGDHAGNFTDIPGATTGTLTTGTALKIAVGPTVWPANTATTFHVNYFPPRSLRLVTTVGVNSVTFSQSYSIVKT